MKPFLLLLPALFCADAHAVRLRDFERRIPLHGETVSGGFYEIAVTPEIRHASLRFPQDLRIVDAGGESWPFFLRLPPPESRPVTIAHTRRNDIRVEGTGGYRQVDLHFGTDRPLHSRLQIHSSGRDFVRQVEIYGSEDQQTWGLMAAGYLLHTDGPRGAVRESVISYPPSNLPFLRVRVFPNSRDSLEPFLIQRIEAEHVERSETVLHELPHTLLPGRKPPEGVQVLLLDLGLDHQPVEAVELSAGGSDHLRRVNVFLRSHDSDIWLSCGGGDIFRIGALERVRVPVRGTGRFLRLEIPHHDDAALEWSEIRVLTRRDTLVTQALSSAEPALYLRSATVPAPRFDLRARMERMDPPPAARTLIPGGVQDNPAFAPGIPLPLGRILSIAAVAGVSASVLLIIYRMMLRQSV